MLASVCAEQGFRGDHAGTCLHECEFQQIALDAEKIEQYANGFESYALNPKFRSFDAQGKLDSEGQCVFLSADTKNEVYTLFENIELSLPSQKVTIFAESLNFDKKSEQLTSGGESVVSIRRGDDKITGKAFSASGISDSFQFMGGVSGSIKAGR